MTKSDTTVVVLQPGYLPWLGFFDQMRRADIFVYYDDVPFDKHGWRNRNRVKSQAGSPFWLTVPVRHRGRHGQAIRDTEIDNCGPWARKHVQTLRHFYAQAPYLDRYLGELEQVLEGGWRRLLDLDIAVIELLCGWLGVNTRIEYSSRLGIEGERSGRLVNICRHFGGTHYLSGNAAQTYLDRGRFADQGIKVLWQNYEHPTYPQLHGEFVPYLSVLDLLLNSGDESSAILAGESPARRGSLS